VSGRCDPIDAPGAPQSDCPGNQGKDREGRCCEFGLKLDGSCDTEHTGPPSGGPSGGGSTGGGSTGGGGGGGSIAAPPGLSPGYLAQYDQLWKSIWAGYDKPPFDQAQIDRGKAAAFQTAKDRAAVDKAALGRDLVARGMARSGTASSKSTDIDTKASAEYARGYRQTLVAAVEQNHQARITALQQAGQLLSQRQQAELATARTSLDRDIANANAQLGWARINAELEIARNSLAQQMALANSAREDDLLRLMMQLMGN